MSYDAPPSSAPIRALGHVPALDSLRAVAVLVVLVHHLSAVLPFWVLDGRFSAGGFLGVDLFFVLSGFLITSLLLKEQHDTGRLRLGRFYLRRALRLLPALVFLFVMYIGYSVQADWPPFGSKRAVAESIVATFLYVMNWRVLENPLGAADLVPIWSLSIEEQFYLVWPLLLIVGLGWGVRTARVLFVIGGAAVAVTLWRAVVFAEWGWFDAYLRTDTRLDGLLWGSLAAALFARGRTPQRLPPWIPWVVGAIGVACMLWVHADDGSAYYGGMSAWIAASVAIVLYLASEPHRWRSGPLALVTQRIGRVSYGLYLWQFPAFWAVRRWTEDWSNDAARAALGVLVLVVFTLLSWHLVEQPALRLKQRLQERWGQPSTAVGRQAAAVTP